MYLGIAQMSTYGTEFTEMARAMQDFFNAVDWRTDPTAHAAAVEVEAVHGDCAAIEAIVRACEHMRAEEREECAFWMSVYGLLVSPEAHVGGAITQH
ncbi:MAG: hypothetical protein AcusKO_03580 [Acuticoccus sp.]